MENILAQVVNLSIPSFDSLDPTTLKIVLIVGLVFLFLVLFAFTRHHLIHTSLHGLWAGLFIGAILVLGIEGGGYYLYTNYIVGNKTEKLPKNFQVVLGDTQKSLNRVLGVQAERFRPSAKDVVSDFRLLGPTDSELAVSAICKTDKQK